jgi:hypothetical protein
MGNMNGLQLDIAEGLGMSPAQLLEDVNKGVDREWLQHKALHSTGPSMNCHYCVDNMEDQGQRWGEEREESND